MRTTFNYLFTAAVLCVLVPAAAHAGNLSLTVFCPPADPVLSTGGPVAPPFSQSLQCPAALSIASAFADTPVNATVQTSANGSVLYTDNVVVTFSGGVGLGYYVPCLNVGYGSSGGSGAMFGPIALVSKFPAGGECNSPLVLQDRVAFTFGVPFTTSLLLEADSVGSGFGLVTMNGFRVFDASGNPLPTATWTATEAAVPEPSLFIPAGIALFILALRRRSRQRAATASSGAFNADRL